MAFDPNPDPDVGPEPAPAEDDPEDAAALARYATDLADGMIAALPAWVERSVARVCVAYRGSVDEATLEDAREAGRMAQAEVAPMLRALLAQDIDTQRANPLALARRAVRYPTQVLADAGVPPVVRDAHAEAQFPDDRYDLTPATFADLDPTLHEAGLRWGAAKAHVHKQRRRAEGRS